MSDDFETRRAIRLMHALNRLISRGYHQIDVLSPPRLPPAGPMIVMSNHTSALDPMLIQSVLQRPVVWMMAREYYDIRGMKPVFDALQIIPVARDGRDSSALRAALRALHAGRVLGIFPEGRIETESDLLPLQTGAAMIALRAGAAILPVYLTGTTRRQRSMLRALLLPQRMRLAFGDPIQLRDHFRKNADPEAPTARLTEALTALRTRTLCAP